MNFVSWWIWPNIFSYIKTLSPSHNQATHFYFKRKKKRGYHRLRGKPVPFLLVSVFISAPSHGSACYNT
jgi:hypothetical protein